MTTGLDQSILPPTDPAPAPAVRRFRLPAARLLAAGLIVAGSCLVVLGVPSRVRPGHAVGANLPVNEGAGDPRDIAANNSPTLAANPVNRDNLAVSNRIDLPQFSCALHVTFDGGASWSAVSVPFPAGEEAPPRCYAPDVAYSADGTMYLTYATLIGIGNTPNAVWVVSSADGGRTLSTPARITGPLAFQPRLTVDRSRPGRLYLTWLQAAEVGSLLFPTTGNPIEAARSDDGGATWSPPVRVSPAGRDRVVAPSTAIGPRGQLSVLYLDLGDDRLDYAGGHRGRGGDPYPGAWQLVLARSGDEGKTWQEAVLQPDLRPTQRFVVFLPPSPSLVVDPKDGWMYAGFTDGRLGDPDVWVWASSDGGATFEPPRRVNDTPAHDGSTQYLPQLAVAPNGRLDVVYYDRRDDPADLRNGVSLQSSTDHGRTFTSRVKVSDQTFDSRIGLGSEHDLADLGSRLAVVAAPKRSLVVWSDTRAGTNVTDKQDLGSAIVETQSLRRHRWWRRGLGIALILSGLAAVAPKMSRSLGRR